MSADVRMKLLQITSVCVGFLCFLTLTLLDQKEPNTWTVPWEILLGRPIVSDCGGETYSTAEFIEFRLYPLSIKHPAYIKDTYNFIEIVKILSVPSDFLFFTIDVESLYTNIDISALGTVRRFFQMYPDDSR